jgi:hypothetical protein
VLLQRQILSLELAQFPGPVSNEWLRREAGERLGELLEGQVIA